jgi:asparagine synthase (glutamine-hydrolysing)
MVPWSVWVVMCGIAGIWNRAGEPVEQASLERMASMLRHRGPDGEGYFLSGDLGLAHRRLKIIDLSDLGRQPMSTVDGRYWITFNGEIHNYVELRGELQANGAVFASQSDTEVVLHAWLAWGPECFTRFNGMWALGVWDDARRELMLSRDRFGIKPLVYCENGPRFAFASEPKAILEVFPEERRPDLAELFAYLAGAYPLCGEATFYSGIRSLPAGHYMTVRADGVTVQRHWNFTPGTEQPRADTEERFRELLSDAVRIRMRSDVPVMSALSGGLDSSAITLLAGRFAQDPVECFSLKYEGDEAKHDESEFAAAAIAGDSRFHLHWVRPTPSNFFDVLAKIVWHHDSPPTPRGRYPCWILMRDVGARGRVLLTGEGSDEQLAGYSRFILPYLLDRVTIGTSYRAPRSILAEFRDLSMEFPELHRMVRRMFAMPAVQFARMPVWRLMSVMNEDIVRSLPAIDPRRYTDSWIRRDVARPYRSRMNNALWTEFTYMGLPEVVHSNDALSMAFSVEVRQPFLDHRVVELSFSLPYDEKIRDGWTKSLLRRALRDILPPRIRDRRGKVGFAAPLREWLTHDKHMVRIREMLLDGTCVAAGILDRKRLEKRIGKVRKGSILFRNVDPLWRMITTEIWYRQSIARTG